MDKNQKEFTLKQKTKEALKGDTSFAAIALVASIIIVLVFSFYFVNYHGSVGSQEVLGQFGDFVGGILNPILSFTTIILLIKSLRFQRIELNKVAEELELTRQVHRTDVNMRHYEYLIEELLDLESDFIKASSIIGVLLEEQIELSASDIGVKGEYRLMDILSNQVLFDAAIKYGYVVHLRKTPRKSETVFQPIEGKFNVLNEQFITMKFWVNQLERLECPMWRALKILDVGNDILKDYYRIQPKQYQSTLSKCCPHFDDFKSSVLHYKIID